MILDKLTKERKEEIGKQLVKAAMPIIYQNFGEVFGTLIRFDGDEIMLVFKLLDLDEVEESKKSMKAVKKIVNWKQELIQNSEE